MGRAGGGVLRGVLLRLSTSEPDRITFTCYPGLGLLRINLQILSFIFAPG